MVHWWKPPLKYRSISLTRKKHNACSRQSNPVRSTVFSRTCQPIYGCSFSRGKVIQLHKLSDGFDNLWDSTCDKVLYNANADQAVHHLEAVLGGTSGRRQRWLRICAVDERHLGHLEIIIKCPWTLQSRYMTYMTSSCDMKSLTLKETVRDTPRPRLHLPSQGQQGQGVSACLHEQHLPRLPVPQGHSAKASASTDCYIKHHHSYGQRSTSALELQEKADLKDRRCDLQRWSSLTCPSGTARISREFATHDPRKSSSGPTLHMQEGGGAPCAFETCTSRQASVPNKGYKLEQLSQCKRSFKGIVLGMHHSLSGALHCCPQSAHSQE